MKNKKLADAHRTARSLWISYGIYGNRSIIQVTYNETMPIKYILGHNRIMSGCIFCAMIKGESPVTKVYENEHMLVIMDTKPITKGHMLVIPKRHAEYLTELHDDLVGEMFVTAKKAALALKKSKLRVKAVNYLMADGAEAGQEVFHAHLHVIPRYRGDGFYLHMPPSYERETDSKDLEKYAGRIRAALEK
jgi:histidine triad (HIT) family protein